MAISSGELASLINLGISDNRIASYFGVEQLKVSALRPVTDWLTLSTLDLTCGVAGPSSPRNTQPSAAIVKTLCSIPLALERGCPDTASPAGPRGIATDSTQEDRDQRQESDCVILPGFFRWR